MDRRGLTSEDAVLVERIIDGSKESYAELVEKYQKQVYNLAYRMTTNKADAEDMTQETFVRAFKKLRSYKAEYSFRNWLLAICANHTKNLFRSRTRRNALEKKYNEQTNIEFSNDDNDSSRKEKFKEALLSIPESLRIALALKHVDGYSYEDISDTLNIGVSAAKMRVKRGREKLVEILKPCTDKKDNER